jgi:hypothetical protein
MNKYTQTENPQGDLIIGQPVESELLEAKFGIGVYKCANIPTSKISYIIAPTPDPKNCHDYRPTSAIAPFETATEAINALESWAGDPQFPRLPRKLRPPDGRRKGNRPKQRDDGVGQMFLDL